MIIICRDTEDSGSATPVEKDVRKSEGQKASVNQRAYELVTFILIMHTYVNEVEQFVRKINGVESVKSDSNSNKLKVKGKVDPDEIRKMVKSKTKTKVKLIFPLAEIEGYEDENEDPEEKLKNEKTKPDDIANKTSEESTTILKIKFCCNACNQKIHTILRNQGLETVALDMDKDLVTVKGTVNVTELRSVLKKDVEVMVPAKKDNVATKKKHRGTGAIDQKDKDAGTMEKKGKEVGTVEKILREKETEPTFKMSRGNGKYAGAMDKKGKKVGSVEIRDKHSEHRGSTSVPNKNENNDSSVNQTKDKDSNYRKNEEASNDGSRLGSNQEEGFGVTMMMSLPCYHRYVDYEYDHSLGSVNDSNMYHWVSEENPNPCSIM